MWACSSFLFSRLPRSLLTAALIASVLALTTCATVISTIQGRKLKGIAINYQ